MLSASIRITCKLTGYTNMKMLKVLKGHMHRLMIGLNDRPLLTCPNDRQFLKLEEENWNLHIDYNDHYIITSLL